MKRVVILFAVLIAVELLVYGQAGATENSLERSVAEGGLISLQLSSGDYTVRAGSSNRISVRWSATEEGNRHSEDMKKIRVHIDTSASGRTIRTEGPTKYAHIVIEVPARSDLHLRMRAGDVRIEGIEGNKDLHLTAGDLYIEAAPQSYSRVNASVTFGGVRARPFRISKDGIKTSFEWNGAGPYTLRASLFAGDVALFEPGTLPKR